MKAPVLVVVLVMLVAPTACGNKSKGPPLAPLPPDKVEEEKPKVVEPAKPEPPPARPVPVGPLEVKIPATKVTVKLVNPGKGKRLAARIGPKAGGKSQVELAFDFGVTQSVGTESQADIVPTVLLAGTAEVTSADKDSAELAIKIEKTDAKQTPGARVPMDEFKKVLDSTIGLKISGKVGANGATGDVTLFLEKQGPASAQVLDLVRLALPPWPPLPAEQIGVGAKWQATTATKLADRLDITMVTDYELVAVKGTVWTIKGTTKITGADQMMQGGKISNIKGTGISEVTLTDGVLPTYKHTIEATFTASEPDPKATTGATLDFKISIGGSLTTKP